MSSLLPCTNAGNYDPDDDFPLFPETRIFREDRTLEKELTTRGRKRLVKNKSKNFAIPSKAPGSGSYPIPDKRHGQNALARVGQHGSPAEKAKVRRAVHKKFPDIGEADEVAPPGREDQVLKLKKKLGVPNAFKVAWSSYDKSHKHKKKAA